MRLDLPIDEVAELYAIGVPTGVIAKAVGTTKQRIKSLIRRESLVRDPGRYEDGVAYMAAPGETFRRSINPGYWVSNMGRVIAMRSKPGTVMTPEVDRDGYLRVAFWDGARYRKHLIHRLVLTAFVGPPEKGQVAAHNNGVRCDNALDNLRWATQEENVADKVRHGTQQIGSRHGNASTDEVSIARLKSAFRKGATAREAAQECGVSIHVAYDVKQGMAWRHVT